jgi:hypothetical protein
MFIKCDFNKNGFIKCKDLIKRLHKMNMQMPMHIFNFFINTLKESKNTPNSHYDPDSNEFDPEAILSFKKL